MPKSYGDDTRTADLGAASNDAGIPKARKTHIRIQAVLFPVASLDRLLVIVS